MTPEVAEAVEEIREAFSTATIEVAEEADGGAIVSVSPIDPGEQYVQRETWISFRIGFQYPYSDVYPHFVRPDLARIDGADLGEGMTPNPFEGRAAIQISRRSNHLNPVTDTATIKLQKVLEWLRSR